MVSAVVQAESHLLVHQMQVAVQAAMLAHGVTEATFERRYGKRLADLTAVEALGLMEGKA